MKHFIFLAQDCDGFLRRVGDAGGGEYIINLDSIIETITMSSVDSIVRERYGSKSARIFRYTILIHEFKEESNKNFISD